MGFGRFSQKGNKADKLVEQSGDTHHSLTTIVASTKGSFNAECLKAVEPDFKATS